MKFFSIAITFLISANAFSQSILSCSGQLSLQTGEAIVINFSVREFAVGKSIYFAHPVIHDTENEVSATIKSVQNYGDTTFVIAESKLDRLFLTFELHRNHGGEITLNEFKGVEFETAFGPAKLKCSFH